MVIRSTSVTTFPHHHHHLLLPLVKLFVHDHHPAPPPSSSLFPPQFQFVRALHSILNVFLCIFCINHTLTSQTLYPPSPSLFNNNNNIVHFGALNLQLNGLLLNNVSQIYYIEDAHYSSPLDPQIYIVTTTIIVCVHITNKNKTNEKITKTKNSIINAYYIQPTIPQKIYILQ